MTGTSLLWLLAGLSAAVPPVVPSPPPPADVDLAPLLAAAGCTDAGRGTFSCASGSAAAALGCDSLERVPGLGGLRPQEPIAQCVFRAGNPPPSEYVLAPHGMRRIYRRYVALAGGKVVLLKSLDAMRARYAPIESADEARSFALAVTGYQDFRHFTPPPGFRYFLKTLPETTVAPSAFGFMVANLRNDQEFGCGPHPTFLVNVEVATDGSLREAHRERAFEDPSTDNLCVD